MIAQPEMSIAPRDLLATCGLYIDDPSKLGAVTIFEPPVAIGQPEVWRSVKVGAFSYLDAGGEFYNVDVGRFCSIARKAVIGPGEHPTDWASTHPLFCGDGVATYASFPGCSEWQSNQPRPEIYARVTIGCDVWIGHGVFIAAGVQIGHGAIIGARSVVTRDVEPYMIVAGSPAKPLRRRFDDRTVERFLRVGWWNYDLRPIISHIDFSEATAMLDVLQEAIDSGSVGRFQPKRFRMERTHSGFNIAEAWPQVGTL